MSEGRTRADGCAVAREVLEPRVPGDLAERHHDLQAGECRELGIEMIGAGGDLLWKRLVVRRRASHRRDDVCVQQLQSIVACVDVVRLAKPARCSAAIRKSPEPPVPSPVNTRPVRFAPCAAGARPSRSSRPGDRQSRARAFPSILVAIRRPLLARDVLAIAPQARAARARHDRGGDAGQRRCRGGRHTKDWEEVDSKVAQVPVDRSGAAISFQRSAVGRWP